MKKEMWPGKMALIHFPTDGEGSVYCTNPFPPLMGKGVGSSDSLAL